MRQRYVVLVVTPGGVVPDGVVVTPTVVTAPVVVSCTTTNLIIKNKPKHLTVGIKLKREKCLMLLTSGCDSTCGGSSWCSCVYVIE